MANVLLKTFMKEFGNPPTRHSRESRNRDYPVPHRSPGLTGTIGRNLFKLAVLLLLLLTAPPFANTQILPATEKQKIEVLIKQVGDLKDAKFIRNGSTYEPATAVRFLRGKWNANISEVKTARDFIDKIASKSGTSGNPYLIRFKDGTEIQSRDFLLMELKKIEA